MSLDGNKLPMLPGIRRDMKGRTESVCCSLIPDVEILIFSRINRTIEAIHWEN